MRLLAAARNPRVSSGIGLCTVYVLDAKRSDPGLLLADILNERLNENEGSGKVERVNRGALKCGILECICSNSAARNQTANRAWRYMVHWCANVVL